MIYRKIMIWMCLFFASGGASMAQDTVNVKNFGAQGNGVADDTKAINSAIRSAARVIYFPPGKYKITDVISLISGKELLGSKQASVIENVNVKEMIKTFGPNKYQQIAMKDLQINGNMDRTVKDRIVVCMQLYNVNSVRIENCIFKNASAAIGLQNCQNITIQNNIVQGMYQQPNNSSIGAGVYGYGIVLNECTGATVSDNILGTSATEGYIMRHAVYISNSNTAAAKNSTDITVRRNTITLPNYRTITPLTGFEYVIKSVGGKNILIENNVSTGGIGGVLLTINFLVPDNIRITGNKFNLLKRYGVFVNPEANATPGAYVPHLYTQHNTFNVSDPNAQGFRIINYKTLDITDNTFINSYKSANNRSIFLYIKKSKINISDKQINIINNKISGFKDSLLKDDKNENVKLFVR